MSRSWRNLLPWQILAAVILSSFYTATCQNIAEILSLHVTPRGLVPIIDGSLSEWNENRYQKILLENLPVSGDQEDSTQISFSQAGSWEGKQDLSGWVSLALDPVALYIFGRILDDHIVPPPTMNYGDWNKGDAIECFLDTDPDDRTDKETFSEDDFQIFLWPGNCGGPTWGIMRKGLNWIGTDGSFEGVEVRFRPLKGGGGYTFEARFPLINFPHLKAIQDGFPIGFNIALGDREPTKDGDNKYQYMTWNGKGLLWNAPRKFGTLIVQDPLNRLATPTAPSSSLELGYLVFAFGLVLAVILFAFLFTWLVRWLAAWPLRRKLIITGTLTLALVTVTVLGTLSRHLSDSMVEMQVKTSAKKVKEVVSLCSGQVKGNEELLKLVKGLPVETRKSYWYHFFPITEPVKVKLPSSRDGTSLLDTPDSPEYLGNWTGHEVRRSGTTAFFLLEEELGDTLSIVLSASRRPGLDQKFFTPGPGQPIASLVILDGRDKTCVAETVLTISPEGVLCVLTDGKSHPMRKFLMPSPRGQKEGIGYELSLDTRKVPEDTTSPYRLALQAADDVHILQLHGISTHVNGRWQGIPFRIESQAGHPLQLVHGRRCPLVSLKNPSWSAPVRIEMNLDRLWIFFKCVNGFPNGSPMNTTVAEVVLTYANGGVERKPLQSGIHLESFRGTRKKHPPRMRTQVALNDVWDIDRGFHVRTRRDMLGLSIKSGQEVALQTVEIKWFEGCKGREEIETVAITGGVSATGKSLPENPHVKSPNAGTLRLKDEMRRELREANITSAVIPVVSGLEPLREDKDVVAYIPLDSINGIRLSRELAHEALIEDVQKWTALALLACLLPLLLVLIADGLAQGRRLRNKLLLAIGLASMPPLALLVVNLDTEIQKHLEKKVQDRARSATDQVWRDVKVVEDRVQTIAREASRNRELRKLLEQKAPTHFDDRVQKKLAELETRWPESDQKEIEILLWDALRRVAFRSRSKKQDRSHEWLLPQVDRSGLYNDFGEILAIGYEAIRSEQESRRWNLIVVRPLSPAFINGLLSEDPEVYAFAFYPGAGYPYAGIGNQGDDRLFSGVTEARTLGNRAAASKDGYASQVRRLGGATCTVGARMLLNAMEEPSLALGAAVDRDKAFSLRRTMLQSALVVGAAMLLLFIIITFLVTRRIIDPLLGLSSAARNLAEGDADMPPLPIHSQDEVGNLTTAFNDMAVQLRKRLHGLDLLNRGMRDLNDRRTAEGLLDTVIRIFDDALSPACVFLALHDPDEADFHILGGKQNGRPLRPRRVKAKESFLLQAMNTGGPELIRGFRWMEVNPGENRLFQMSEGTAEQVVTLPLDYQGDPIGLIVLIFTDLPFGEGESSPVDRESLMVLATMADQIAGALENARLYRLAVEDPVTGLFLQGYFEGRLKDEIQRAARHDRALTLIKIQVEEISIVSSQHGPAGVNQLLKAVSRAVRTVMDREENFASRFDNNQFALALPEADREAGYDAAHRIAGSLMKNPVHLTGGRALKVTPRIGVATFPEDAASFEFLLAAVEQGMDRTDFRPSLAIAGPSSSSIGPAPKTFEDTGVVLKSPRSLDLVKAIERIADSVVTVLITGETGTGKEVFAELIHRRSNRKEMPLIKVNCAALPELLLESELFGHERGAFTGAYRKKMGRFEMANGGTLFLDEIGEITASTQVKLLRVLQDKKIERIGGTHSIELDVRIIAATNQDVLELVRGGKFREDLYYRLNVISFEVPPLRERKEEIPLLVDLFIRTHNRDQGDSIAGIRPKAMDKLHNYPWPGNIRELKNLLERAMLSVDGPDGFIEPEHIQITPPKKSTRKSPSTARHPPRSSLPATMEPDPGTPNQDLESLVANPRQLELLKLLQKKKTITNQEYFTMMNISHRTGLRDLNDLIKKGLLQRIGSRRGAIYKIRDENGDQDAHVNSFPNS